MTNDRTLRARWTKADGDRQSILSNARQYAELTIPEVLPRPAWDGKSQLITPYTSMGPIGVTSLTGKMLTALFPASLPWFTFTLPGRTEMDPRAATDRRIAATIQAAKDRLFLWDLIVSAAIESSNLAERSHIRQHTLRSRKREALEALIIVGDVLEELTDDLELRLYRMDQYVTIRESSGNAVMHCIKEKIDPLSLPEDEYARAAFAPGQVDPSAFFEDRLVDRYRIVEWQPRARTWNIRHEVNDRIVHEVDEPVSPFMSTVFSLAGGSHYGTPFVKRVFGDLNPLNETEARLLDILAAAGKHLTALDRNSQTEEADLARPSGSIVRARVEGGVVQDVAPLSFANVRDFQMLTASVDRKERRLGRAFLVEDAAQPQGDRVTRLAIQRIAAELDGATGGLYAPIAAQQQIPLVARATHILRKQAVLPPMPKDSIEIEALTGLPAIAREQQAQRLITWASAVQQMGPAVLQRVNMDVLLDVFNRAMGIHEPGLILSPEQVRAQQNEAIRQQTALAAGEQAVATAGRIVENAVAAGQ